MSILCLWCLGNCNGRLSLTFSFHRRVGDTRTNLAVFKISKDMKKSMNHTLLEVETYTRSNHLPSELYTLTLLQIQRASHNDHNEETRFEPASISRSLCRSFYLPSYRPSWSIRRYVRPPNLGTWISLCPRDYTSGKVSPLRLYLSSYLINWTLWRRGGKFLIAGYTGRS